jgi:hypothetical protein
LRVYRVKGRALGEADHTQTEEVFAIGRLGIVIRTNWRWNGRGSSPARYTTVSRQARAIELEL